MFKAYDDETLVYMTLAGRQDAYGELVLRWQGAALAAANSVLRSVYLSEDAVQDAFVAAWMKLNTLAEPSKFGPWVCKAAKNRAKNILRTYSGWMDISVYENKEDDGMPSPEESVISADEKEEVRRAIESLPQKVRTVITLHYFEGLSVAEIADRMRIPVGTVKWQLSDGRKRLRGELSAMDENYNDTLLQKVMKKVEELKLWSSKTNKDGFDAAYRDVLSDVTDLPESEKKYHAMADVLLRGFWWLPGKKNDEMLARIADAAEKGHNDEATAFICSKEDARLSGDAKIEFIRDKQIPRLVGKGLPIALGSEWLALASAYFSKEEREKGYDALDKAESVIPECDILHTKIKAVREAERIFDLKFKDKDENKFIMTADAAEIRLDPDGLVLFRYEEYNEGRGYGFVRDASFIIGCAKRVDGGFYRNGAKPGDTFTLSEGGLIFVSDNETVITPAGTFDGCELWESRPQSTYYMSVYRTYYKRGVGIVKYEVCSSNITESAVLASYKTAGDQLLPLEPGNEWEYVRDGGDSLDIMIKLRVEYNDGKKANMSAVSYIDRVYYDENSFSDMASAVRYEYFSYSDSKLHDVSKYAERLLILAKTETEKLHAKYANSIWQRLKESDWTNPDRKSDCIWNFFTCGHIYEKNGEFHRTHEPDFGFELKGWDTGCTPVIYNDVFGMLQNNFECVFSDQWVPGYGTEKDFMIYDTDVKATLRCEDAGTVTVKAGTFDDCIRIRIESEGMDEGHDYICGNKNFIFAPRVGLIRTENYYAEKTKCAVYELVSYKGEGEGYFPYNDGMVIRFELLDPPAFYTSSSEFSFINDKFGRLMIYADRAGMKERHPAPEYLQTADEQKEEELWEKKEYLEYYTLWGKNNLEILLHQLHHGPYNQGDGRLYSKWHMFRMKAIESFCGGKVLPAWYGYYAEVAFRAACATFSFGAFDLARSLMETAFEYYDKWNAIPDGELLDVGVAEVTASMKIKKGSAALILQTGEPTVASVDWIFKGNKGDLMYRGLTAPRGWEWFDPARNEPFFAEYVKRSEKYLN